MCKDSLIARDWYYSATGQDVIDDILKTGNWHPEKNANSMYGTAVYLADSNWYKDDAAPRIIRCRLSLSPDEFCCSFDASSFDASLGVGRTGKHLRGYLKSQGIRATTTPSHGDSTLNTAIKDFFAQQRVRAVCFDEYVGVPVVAVYDTTAIVDLCGVASDDVPQCPV